MGTRITISNSAAISCGDGTNAKTLLQYTAASGVQARLIGYGISFTGTSSSVARAQHRLRVGATGGTASDISSRIATLEGASTAVGTAKDTFTVEPSGGKDIRNTQMAPTGPFQSSVNIPIAGGATISIEAICASMTGQSWFEIELG